MERVSKEVNEERKRLLEKLYSTNKNALYIGRVPPEHKKIFMDLANNRFCGDYGMLLVHLLDQFSTFENIRIELGEELDILASALDMVIDDVAKLKGDNKQDYKEIKMLNGRILKIPKKEE